MEEISSWAGDMLKDFLGFQYPFDSKVGDFNGLEDTSWPITWWFVWELLFFFSPEHVVQLLNNYMIYNLFFLLFIINMTIMTILAKHHYHLLIQTLIVLSAVLI